MGVLELAVSREIINDGNSVIGFRFSVGRFGPDSGPVGAGFSVP